MEGKGKGNSSIKLKVVLLVYKIQTACPNFPKNIGMGNRLEKEEWYDLYRKRLLPI